MRIDAVEIPAGRWRDLGEDQVLLDRQARDDPPILRHQRYPGACRGVGGQPMDRRAAPPDRAAPQPRGRGAAGSEARRFGKGCVLTVSTRWSTYNLKKKK